MLSKTELLEGDQNPLILTNIQMKKEATEARATAVELQDLYQEAEDEDDKYEMIPLHVPGTLDEAVFRKKYPGSSEEAILAQSKVQEKVFEDSFRPLRVTTVQGKEIWTENASSDEYMLIKQEYGDEIAGEVQRAWKEMQTYQYMSSSTKRVPWHVTEKRPLSVSEIIMLLGVHCFKATKKEDMVLETLEAEAEDDEEDAMDQDESHGNAQSEIRKGIKRMLDEFDDLAKELPTPDDDGDGGAKGR